MEVIERKIALPIATNDCTQKMFIWNTNLNTSQNSVIFEWNMGAIFYSEKQTIKMFHPI